MRNRFSSVLEEVAKKDENLILLVGDIGFNVFDKFIESHPNRFINAGVAETNMIGSAAGLAMQSFKPVVYTIIPFLLMRTFEHIRNDLCMHNLQITLVGVGGGLSYDTLGPTHHSIEDIAIMRSLPNMQVLTPADPNEVEWIFPIAHNHKGPTYLRLGKGGEKDLLSADQIASRRYGFPHQLFDGDEISIISSGPILSEVLQARKLLNEQNIFPSIINIHALKPFEKSDFIKKIVDKKIVVTVEEHSIIGGLGDTVSDAISEIENSPIQLKIGINDTFVKEIGKRDYQFGIHGLKAEKIYKKIIKFMSLKL